VRFLCVSAALREIKSVESGARANPVSRGGVTSPALSFSSVSCPAPAAEMIVRSLFFAQYRDFAGADEMNVELPDGASVADLVVRLRGGEGGLSRLPASPVVAVNMDYAPHSTALREGDEVAFIPPVAGG